MEYSVEAKIQILYGVCLFDNFQIKMKSARTISNLHFLQDRHFK